jgi:lipid-A-disaccharide synthase
MESFQVMGFVDIVKHLPRLLVLFRNVRDHILTTRPHHVITIDYPEFHLLLAASLRKWGYQGQLTHYVCPSVWAWRKSRITSLARHYNQLLTLFPFESACFAHTSLPTHFIGHPLADTPPLPSTRDPHLLALFPGSRRSEIQRTYPYQIAAARQLQRIHPEIKIAISVASSNLLDTLQKLTSPTQVTWIFQEKKSHLMQTCHVAIATSGTVTLELCMHKTPSLITYAMHPFDVLLAKHLFKIHLPFYCIVNLVAGQEVYPELFGPNLQTNHLQQKIKPLWQHQDLRLHMQDQCRKIQTTLHNPEGAAQTAAILILEDIKKQIRV